LFCISFFRYTFGKPVSGKATLRIKRKYQYRHWGWREEPQRKTIDSIEQSFPVTITILILSSTSLFRYKYIEGFVIIFLDVDPLWYWHKTDLDILYVPFTKQ
jgi:hypothetical protein